MAFGFIDTDRFMRKFVIETTSGKTYQCNLFIWLLFEVCEER